MRPVDEHDFAPFDNRHWISKLLPLYASPPHRYTEPLIGMVGRPSVRADWLRGVVEEEGSRIHLPNLAGVLILFAQRKRR